MFAKEHLLRRVDQPLPAMPLPEVLFVIFEGTIIARRVVAGLQWASPHRIRRTGRHDYRRCWNDRSGRGGLYPTTEQARRMSDGGFRDGLAIHQEVRLGQMVGMREQMIHHFGSLLMTQNSVIRDPREVDARFRVLLDQAGVIRVTRGKFRRATLERDVIGLPARFVLTLLAGPGFGLFCLLCLKGLFAPVIPSDGPQMGRVGIGFLHEVFKRRLFFVKGRVRPCVGLG